MTTTVNVSAQNKIIWTSLPPLPGDKGWAGMYAGVSKGVLFCMGGANFPGKFPWEGGKKKWYDGIYMLYEGGEWIKLGQRLPGPLGYGVTVSYKESVIIIGGCNETQHFSDVMSYTWTHDSLSVQRYPSLPVPLAYMTGTLVNNLIVIAGGSETPTGEALRKCWVLDLENLEKGWFEIEPWPGVERKLAVSACYDDQFYLFSGETVGTSAANEKFPQILQDAYRLKLSEINGKWVAQWQALSLMPKGVAAAGSPLPVYKNGTMICWGGVDAVSRLHEDPATYPGISKDVLLYQPEKDTWQLLGIGKTVPARVTLPVVYWNKQWVYISGETKPGIRTRIVNGIKYLK